MDLPIQAHKHAEVAALQLQLLGGERRMVLTLISKHRLLGEKAKESNHIRTFSTLR
jgi:hypothetical protein